MTIKQLYDNIKSYPNDNMDFCIENVFAWSAGGHLPNGIIKWGEGIAGFFIMPPKCNAVWHLVGNYENKESLEVLGNIHDNPELIKEEEK